MIHTLLSLQKKYMELAEEYGYKSIFGKNKEFSARMAAIYNDLFIKITEEILYERK